MTRLLNLVMIAATVLMMAPFAHAESVLVTAPLARGGVPFTCALANAGEKEVDVRVEVLDSGGNVDGSITQTVVPRGSLNYGLTAASGSSVRHCQFTLLKGAKNKVRAQACAYSSVDTSGPCLSTSEARCEERHVVTPIPLRAA